MLVARVARPLEIMKFPKSHPSIDELQLNSASSNQKRLLSDVTSSEQKVCVNNINHSTGSLMRDWRGSLVGLCCVFISELQH